MRRYKSGVPSAENSKTNINEDKTKDKTLHLAVIHPGSFVEWIPSAGTDTVLSHTWDLRRGLAVASPSVGVATTNDDIPDDHDGESDLGSKFSDDMLNRMREEINLERKLRTVIQQKIRVGQEMWEKTPYELISFEGKGQAELIRLLFVTAQVQYEDTRLTEDVWAEMKSATPYGSLPVLKKCGHQWGETSAIVRTLATTFRLLGSTNEDHLTTEATYERLRRLQNEHSKAISFVMVGEKSKEKMEWAQSQLTHVIFPAAFKEWEALIRSGPGPFIISSGMTFADIAIMDFVDQCSGNLVIAPILEDYPAVSDMLTMVRREPHIRAYLDERAKE